MSAYNNSVARVKNRICVWVVHITCVVQFNVSQLINTGSNRKLSMWHVIAQLWLTCRWRSLSVNCEVEWVGRRRRFVNERATEWMAGGYVAARFDELLNDTPVDVAWPATFCRDRHLYRSSWMNVPPAACSFTKHYCIMQIAFALRDIRYIVFFLRLRK